MKYFLAMLAGSIRHGLVRLGALPHDTPLSRARCRTAHACRVVDPRYAFDVRLDARWRVQPQFVVIPVELLPGGHVLELDAFSLCETHLSLKQAIRRAAWLSQSADVTRFNEATYLFT